MGSRLTLRLPDAVAEGARRQAGLGTVGSADDIAAATVMLCRAGTITGQTIVVDGGIAGVDELRLRGATDPRTPSRTSRPRRCETTAMAERPSGTVTFLFTDIEGSTRRWEADPDAMRVALAAHDAVLRAAVEGRGGWLFKHTGDGVCAAFSSARAAVDAAVDGQRGLGLPVRMGIATGEAEQRGEDYFGPALNRAARVMAVGHGGQILVAQSTAALLDEVGLADLGEHRLRDLSGAHRLFQVRAEGRRESFPALRTVDAVPGNLPVLATSFVGRDTEVKELCELVRAHRMVTLTGVGGVGKTRLALQVAAELTGEFLDGVWLLELAPVGDPGAVPDVVATTLGITPQAAMSVTAAIAQALVGRHLALVVDNCEHVLDAAADRSRRFSPGRRL